MMMGSVTEAMNEEAGDLDPAMAEMMRNVTGDMAGELPAGAGGFLIGLRSQWEVAFVYKCSRESS